MDTQARVFDKAAQGAVAGEAVDLRTGLGIPLGGLAAPSSATSSLFADPRFREILRAAQDHGMMRSEFDEMPLPEGRDPDEVWAALMDVRRSQATYFLDTWHLDGRDVPQWFTETTTMKILLRDLSARTQASSPLGRAVAERDALSFMAKPLVEEAAATVLCDSMRIDVESARSVIMGERPASSPAERLVLNMHELLLGVSDQDIANVTPSFVEQLYARLMDGVDASSFSTDIPWGDEWPIDPMSHDDALAEICGLIHETLVDRADHPILVGQKIGCKCWKTSPFPHCNYAVGSLLSRLYLVHKGYPVFAYIPSSSLTLEWKKGTYVNKDICPYGHSSILGQPDRDWTTYWESCLKLMSLGLDEMERYALAVKATDDCIMEALAADRSLNHRQVDVLRQALLVPRTAFRTGKHCETYDIAHSTARADLVGLVRLGFLEMRYESKAQVFTARFDMKRALAARYGL